MFLGSASGIADGDPGSAAAQLESDQADAYLGWSVAGAGDVNDDGYDDVIVGRLQLRRRARRTRARHSCSWGAAAGITDGGPGSAAVQLESDQAGANLGRSVAGASDVNDDGYADVIAGAPTTTRASRARAQPSCSWGAARGSPAATPILPIAQLESDQASAYLGRGIAGPEM